MIKITPKIKIAFFTGSFQFGGTERFLLSLLKNIDRSRFEPIVMCFSKSGDFLPDLEELGIRIEVFKIKNGFFNTTGFKSLIKAFFFLRKNKIQILHSLADWANLFSTIVGKISGVKVILVSQSYDKFIGF